MRLLRPEQPLLLLRLGPGPAVHPARRGGERSAAPPGGVHGAALGGEADAGDPAAGYAGIRHGGPYGLRGGAVPVGGVLFDSAVGKTVCGIAGASASGDAAASGDTRLDGGRANIDPEKINAHSQSFVRSGRPVV